MARRQENPKVRSRIEIGKRRITNILLRHGVATARTLEQKISDAGPTDQRVEPVHLTTAIHELSDAGLITARRPDGHTPWYSHQDSPSAFVEDRLKVLLPIYQAITDRQVTLRCGQALEIAFYKELQKQKGLSYLGAFTDLQSHRDSTLYKKTEPPSVFSGKVSESPLDFIAFGGGLTLGIEIKNTRPWYYPDTEDVLAFLRKCCALDIQPVFIARRISYVAFTEVFKPCGVVIHEQYNQLYADHDKDIAMKAKDKENLGYHDIRCASDPNPRLTRFVAEHLFPAAIAAKQKFDEHKDLLNSFATNELTYLQFHVELRKRLGVYLSDEDMLHWHPED